MTVSSAAHRRDDQRKAQPQSLVTAIVRAKKRRRGLEGSTLRRNGSHFRNGDGYLLRWGAPGCRCRGRALLRSASRSTF
eukprot:5929623-Prymnesium_polylepis.1